MSPKQARPLPHDEPDASPRASRKHSRNGTSSSQGPQRRDPAGSMLNFLILVLLALVAFRMFNQPKPSIPKGAQAPRFVLIDVHKAKKWKPTLQGKITVLHFWATWCPTCIRGLASASKRAKLLQEQGIQSLLVSTDLQMPTSELQTFLTKYKIPQNEWAYHHIGPRASAQFKIRVLPSLVVIGPDARVAHYATGGLSDNALRQLIQKLKSKKHPPTSSPAPKQPTPPPLHATQPMSASRPSAPTLQHGSASRPSAPTLQHGSASRPSAPTLQHAPNQPQIAPALQHDPTPRPAPALQRAPNAPTSRPH
ncbi:redoxin domain-containing protein [Myxococcota bacterium]|nr:redoxin domain-containing protein [Myxococcota bacterium]